MTGIIIMHKTVSIVLKLIFFLCIVCQFALAQDSREGDSLALVAIEEANGSLGWNFAEPIDTWSGVTAGAGAADRVTSLYMGNKNVGTIPAEIGNLTKLDALIVNNGFISEIPAEIGNCVSLIEVVFDNNQLFELPTTIGALTSLLSLSVKTNFLASLPAEIGDLSSLIILILEDNDLPSISAEVASLTSLTTLSLSENQLHFDDIELMNSVETYYYSPQKTIGIAKKDTLKAGLKIGVVVRGTQNHYAWTLDSVAIGGDTDSIAVTDIGVYVCTITSDSITDLTLTHQPITVIAGVPIITEKSNLSLNSNFSIVANPYNNLTTISYHLSDFSHVELTIFNITGQKVSTIVSQKQPSGNYIYEWDAGNLAGGAYFCQFTSDDLVIAKKIMLIE